MGTMGIGAATQRRARWPWALAAVTAGAAAGAAAAYGVRRLRGEDRPGALEPEQLQAVVDHPADDSPRHD